MLGRRARSVVEPALHDRSLARCLRLRDVAVDRVHEPEREQPFPLCIERGVVLEDQFNESAAIDQPQILARALHVQRVGRIRAERHEEAEFGPAVREGASELLHDRTSDGRGRPLALDLDDRRLDAERIATRDYIDTTVSAPLCHRRSVSHRPEEGADELLEPVRLQRLEDADDEVLRIVPGTLRVGFDLGQFNLGLLCLDRFGNRTDVVKDGRKSLT
jgi:hypothetical protein